MDNITIGKKLRELRDASGMTAEQVINILQTEYNIFMSTSSLYSYETGYRAITAEYFIALLMLYDCKDVRDKFSDIQMDYKTLSTSERKLIEHYRKLKPKYREMVELIVKHCK